jgi:exodeoxyribonuclease X
LDFESTGEKPNIFVIEAGWCNLVPIFHADEVPHHWEIDAPKSFLCDPGIPVSCESSAVNHITTAMILGMESPDVVINRAFDVPRDAIFASHNADFEKDLCGNRSHQWIDTYKVAVALAPNAPSFKLQALRYWLKLDVDAALGYPAHRAAPDAYVTAVMLMRMLTKLSPEEMVDISNRPVFLPRLFFGKWAKVPIGDVEESYLNWILNTHEKNPDEGFDGNVIFTASEELRRRRGGTPS